MFIVDPTQDEIAAADSHFVVLLWDDHAVSIHKDPDGFVPFPALLEGIKLAEAEGLPMSS